MAITDLTVKGYRSIRDLYLNLRSVNVLVGPNGCGKSNLYRSMYLLHAAASGELARAIAEEGGMPSVIWAGHPELQPRRPGEPIQVKLGVTVGSLQYELILGLPAPGDYHSGDSYGYFKRDPRIKEEHVLYTGEGKRQTLLERDRSSLWLRDSSGKRVSFTWALSPFESVLTQLREPHRFPQLTALREELVGWRFYHHFRTDPESPIRHPQIGVYTPVLAHDGRDLAAALASISGSELLHDGIEKGLDGASLEIDSDSNQRFMVCLAVPGIGRAFDARELSDGTLRYLCLLAALLSKRPPSLLALNEPETSLHPDLHEPLARLIAEASKTSQLWITTHSRELADCIEKYTGVAPVELKKTNGATLLKNGAFGGTMGF